jgi:hypothetical protein
MQEGWYKDSFPAVSTNIDILVRNGLRKCNSKLEGFGDGL